jgi:hypothetical protein
MTPFDEQYPNIARWVQDGWIEIGQDEYSHSFIRVLDIGGLATGGRGDEAVFCVVIPNDDQNQDG